MFKGSLLMPLEDLLTAMPDDVRIPSLPTFSIITFRRALQKARKEMSSLPVTSAAGAAALVKGLPTLRVRGSLIGAVLGSVVALCWSVRRLFPQLLLLAMSAVDGLPSESYPTGRFTVVQASSLPQIPMSRVTTQRIIGKGSFGEVCLSRWEDGHMDVAVKANGVSCMNATAIDNERELLEILFRHPHGNILVVYGIITDAPDGSVRLVMAYCAGGSLDAHLNNIRDAGEVCRALFS